MSSRVEGKAMVTRDAASPVKARHVLLKPVYSRKETEKRNT